MKQEKGNRVKGGRENVVLRDVFDVQKEVGVFRNLQQLNQNHQQRRSCH